VPRNIIQVASAPAGNGQWSLQTSVRHGACHALQGMIGWQYRRLGQHCRISQPAGENGFEFTSA